MRPKPVFLLAVAFAVVSTIALAGMVRPAPRAAAIEVAASAPAPTATATPMLMVDVQGSVAHPGVYRLPAGARVSDAIAAAGGLLPDADPAGLNRAAPVRDGARIYAPARGEVPPAGSLGSDAERLLDLNHASAQDLTALPGIGPATADRIVRSRDKSAFHSVDELQTRGLISARVLADIRELVSVR
jgi:competence protein ComEA